jgi:hypothetical protein
MESGTSRLRRWLRVAAIGAVGLVLALGTALWIVSKVHDGPIGPIAGGPLRTGERIVERDVDWAAANIREVELQLVEPAHSRTVGAMVHEGQLFIPCDLGFLWRRVPEARFRTILSVIWSVKHWHEDALRDGRVVLRANGKLYERQAVRVTDPELLVTLRSLLEIRAAEYFSAPGMLEVPGDPEAIWFFRVDPRP